MNIKFTTKMAWNIVSLVCGVGSLIAGVATKKDDMNEIAEKAAKIVMDKQSK